MFEMKYPKYKSDICEIDKCENQAYIERCLFDKDQAQKHWIGILLIDSLIANNKP